MTHHLQQTFSLITSIKDIPKEEKFDVRKRVVVIDRNINGLMKKEEVRLSEVDKNILKDELKTVRKVTDYSPTWVLFMISLSLGGGTMIGWKRL